MVSPFQRHNKNVKYNKKLKPQTCFAELRCLGNVLHKTSAVKLCSHSSWEIFSLSLFSVQNRCHIQEEKGGIGRSFLGHLGSWRSDGCSRWMAVAYALIACETYAMGFQPIQNVMCSFFSRWNCLPSECFFRTALDLAGGYVSCNFWKLCEADSFRKPPFYSISHFFCCFSWPERMRDVFWPSYKP